MGSNQVLHTWQVPERVSDASFRDVKKLARRAVPRLLVITTVLLGVLYLLVKKVAPDELDIDWSRIFLQVYLLSVGMIAVTFFVYPWVLRRSPVVYTITERGIMRQDGSATRFSRWSAIESYSVTNGQPVPDSRLLTLNSRDRRRQIPLPDGRQADEVIDTVAAFVGMRVSPDSHAVDACRLSRRQYGVLYGITFLYSIGLAGLLDYCFMKNDNKDVAMLLQLLSLLLGGGTVGVVLLFGLKAFKERQLVRYMLIFNFTTFTLTMLFFVLLAFYHLSELVK